MLKSKDELYSVHPKGKRFQITGFCAYCYKDVKIGDKHQCLICGTKVKRKSTNEKLIRMFEEMCHVHSEVMEAWIPTTPETKQVFVKMKIGFYTYFISIRYLLEFNNLALSDDKEDSYDKFLKHIERTCPRIAF